MPPDPTEDRALEAAAEELAMWMPGWHPSAIRGLLLRYGLSGPEHPCDFDGCYRLAPHTVLLNNRVAWRFCDEHNEAPVFVERSRATTTQEAPCNA